MKETVLEKLKVLAESAKYDVSCASSGVTRKHRAGGVGSAAGWGICHSFTADGRCVSLLKIMLTNVCIYDCAYCINRRSNDIPRAAFTPGELAELTIEFYRRNYIEGFSSRRASSAIPTIRWSAWSAWPATCARCTVSTGTSI